MVYCRDWTLVKHESHAAVVQPLFCRSWRCPECAPRRAEQLKWQAMSGQPSTFITLTAKRGNFSTKSEAAKALALAWRKLRLYAIRKFKLDAFPFLAVFEEHKSGWPHLHIICRVRYIPQRWISAVMKKYIGSPIVDIRKVKTRKGAARYVTKYISKASYKFEGVKRYWASKDWEIGSKRSDKAVFDANVKCDVREAPWWYVVTDFIRKGYVARNSDGGDVWHITDGSGLPP